MTEHRPTLLVCTVGGSPEPIVQTIRHWQPVRVCFVHTSQIDIEATIVARANAAHLDLDPGRYDCFELPDGQDLESCLDRLRHLTPVVQAWLARNSNFQVVVDFTGGTKCMSAAIALHARQWRCLYSYVGGDDRTRDGVGVVVTGAEKVVLQANPWNTIGSQAIEEYTMLFDQRSFAAAVRVADEAKRGMSRPDRKRGLSALELLAKAFDAWERFDHKAAGERLRDVDKSANDLRAVLGRDRADRVLDEIQRFVATLDQLCATTPPSRQHVIDLLGNASRRNDEQRHDDAVARLYRAIEAAAQTVLRESHGVTSTANVPLDVIPSPLRHAWAPRAVDGSVMLGLQDAYKLLDALGDPIGQAFQHAGLDDPQRSPLVARNHSILAHGFERVSAAVFDRLWQAALTLIGCRREDLPAFPKLGDPTSAED